MANLITAAEFVALKKISVKYDSVEVDKAIEAAEETDLYNILGDFYFDVKENADEAEYSELMAGSSFEYCGEKFIHKGIKALLADYAYSRYIFTINFRLTPFGAQTKLHNDSKEVDRQTIKDLSKQAQIDAGAKFEVIKKYILSKPQLFTRYPQNKPSGTGFNSPRIYKF